MSDFVIYYNPACSKCRATLTLLRERGIEPRVIEYLKSPPDNDELRRIVSLLGIAPEQLVRKGEQAYKDCYAGKTLTDAEWIEAMVANPILIERPIVVSTRGAVIARPPENVERLLE